MTSLRQGSGSVSGSEPVDGLLRVEIPDEQQGTIISRTLPARPTTSARDVCKMLGNKLRITSPVDYGLFKLIDGCGESVRGTTLSRPVDWRLRGINFKFNVELSIDV